MKNKQLTIFLSAALISSMMLNGCNTASAPESSVSSSVSDSTTSASETNVSSDVLNTDNASSTLSYISEMDKSSIMTVSIEADPVAWQSMLDNATNEEYISANVTINGITIENVGIRPKGNSSLSSIARDEETDRYSFKIKFDEYVDGQTWLGLDMLVLNSNYSDASSMKEYLSYDIMSYIGVDSPLYAYADIAVNGENWGFYLAIEEMDSAYLMRTKNDEGELYKPESMDMGGGMPDRPDNVAQGNEPVIPDDAVQGDAPVIPDDSAQDDEPVIPDESAQGDAPVIPDDSAQDDTPVIPDDAIQGDAPIIADDSAQSDTPIMPDGEERSQGGMGGFGRATGGVSLVYTDDEISSYSAIFDNAETKTDESDHQKVIEALKNLNNGTELETYIDVDSVLRYLAAHTIVVNLDSYSGNMAHNYYLYENNGQLSMLPWDYNMAFGGFQSGDASSIVNFPIDTPVSGVDMAERPMIAKLLEVPEYLELYHQYLQEIIDGYFLNGTFEQTIDSLNTMISDYIENDPSAFFTYEEYQAAVTELKELGTLRAESVQGQLSGSIPSTSDGQVAEPEKLIDASSVDLSSLGSMHGGSGGGGQMFDIPEGLTRETMWQAMEIVRTVTDGVLTEAQKTQLYELGLTDEQIEQILSTPMNGGFDNRSRQPE